jgi:hypothetical protein
MNFASGSSARELPRADARRGPADCGKCVHFRTAPYSAPRTGCYHPEHMLSKQKDAYLKEQEIPGDHRKLNLRGDCPKYEPRARKPSLLARWLSFRR